MNSLPEYGEWLPKVWDSYLEDLVGYQDFHNWARLPATFRWHEFHRRLASAIEAGTVHESAVAKPDAPTFVGGNRDKIERVAVKLPQAALDAWVEYDPPEFKHNSTLVRDAFMSGWLAASIEPPADLAGLCERLRRTKTQVRTREMFGSIAVQFDGETREVPINPDGPAAADAIEALSALQQGER